MIDGKRQNNDGDKEKRPLELNPNGLGKPPSAMQFFLLGMLIFLLVSSLNRQSQITYDNFLSNLSKGGVKHAVVSSDRITGELKDGKEGVKHFSTVRVDEDMASLLRENNVPFEGAREDNMLFTVLLWTFGGLIFLSFLSSLGQRLKGGISPGSPFTVGKSNARVYIEQEMKVTFDDVAGLVEAKEELKEIISLLTEPGRYRKLGARLPRGILLVGPPGTGKTLLARALAGEAGVPFLSINGSEFVEMFVGVGAARVRDLFKKAEKHAPCIIFIDELDALGKSRGMNPLTGSNDEKEQTLNQLLSEMDGFDTRSGVIMVAATNRPEILDQALLRSGRFDRQIAVDRPDRRGRKAILEVHGRPVKLDENLDLEDIARVTPGFSGADLAGLMNEAALLAARHGAKAVTEEHLNEALERMVGGLEKRSRILSYKERNMVAHHEIGHALVSLALPGCHKVHRISIIPRGIQALGYTMNQPQENRFIISGPELRHRLAGLMGGRAAEILIFEETSTGAADDFEKATEIARSLVTRFGMSRRLGMVAYERQQHAYLSGSSSETGASPLTRRYSEATAREIDCEVREIIADAFETAMAILSDNEPKLRAAAEALLEKETISGDELRKITGDLELPEHSKNGDRKEIQGAITLKNSSINFLASSNL
ncbi:MAG: ATP-dependent zinc metalloprotease FtsH [Candidatus Obscuribacterales bacterium]